MEAVGMARKKPAPLGKVRTREHVIADLGVNHVERQVLLCDWTVERFVHDYGLDLMLFTYTPEGEVESGAVYFQVKATEKLAYLRRGEIATFRIDRADIRGWLRQRSSVILVVYDVSRGHALWVHVQAYFASVPGFNRFIATGTITLHLPSRQVFTPEAVGSFRRLRDELYGQEQSR